LWVARPVVLSDLFGESGLDMLDALVNQEAAPEQIAQLARKQAKKKIPQIQAAMEGHHMTEHHRLLIRHSMRHLAFLEDEIAELDAEIVRQTEVGSLQPAMELVETIPGIKQTAAAALVGRNGCGYESVSGTAATAFLDRCQSGEQRERRQTQEWPNQQRKPMGAPTAGGMRLERHPEEGLGYAAALPTIETAAPTQARLGRSGSLDRAADPHRPEQRETLSNRL
jgi:hypothetical protein